MDKIEKNKKVKIGLAVPYTCLPIAKFKYAYTLAQNVSEFDKGAYTSQISVDMIKQFKNVKGSLVGHSECRSLLNESDAQINKKVLNLLAKDMQTIFCIGETKEIYEKGQTIDVIKSQIQQGLQGVTENNLRNLVVAYEPI
jgi:triosephosphate isomerase